MRLVLATLRTALPKDCAVMQCAIYRIYANILRIFFLEFSEEKLRCAHYLKQGWYCSAAKQMIPSRFKE